MSDQLLIGADGKWQTAANWDPAGTVPVTDELAGIPDTQNSNITDSTGSAKTAKLEDLITHPGYAKSFGVSGSPIQTSAKLVHVMGAGDFFFETHKNGGSAFVTDEVRVEAANPNAHVEIGSDAVEGTSTIALITALRGNIIIPGNTLFVASTGLVAVDEVDGRDDVNLSIVSTAGTLPEFTQRSGKSFVDNVVTRMTLNGGECVKDVNKVTTIDIFEGGVLVYNHGAVAGEVIICRVHSGGVLDLTQNSLIKVFDYVIRHRGGVIHKLKGLHTFTKYDQIEEEG